MGQVDKSKILIVDDDEDIRDVLTQTLGNDQYQLLTSKRGDEALEIAKKQKPDVIILDLMIPGIDGIEVCRRLKEDKETYGIPIIMLTVRTSVRDKIEGFITGADEYITKPFDPSKVEATVKAVLKRIGKQ